MYEEYFTAYKMYRSKYGEHTFLLYQVGAFFEVYAKKSNEEMFNAIKIYGEICDLTIALKQNGIYMAGFRDYMLDKYIEKLHPHGYTVVVCAQEESPAEKSKKFIRKEVGIFSPGTTITDNSHTLSNHMSCIWIQKTNTLNQQKYVFGMSNLNIMNGKSNLSEHYESYYHNPTTYDNIDTFLNIYNPIELIFIHNVETTIVESILQFLQIKSKKCHVIDLNHKEEELTKQAIKCESQVYQREIIGRFFPKLNVDVFNYDLNDKPIALQSYCFLLNFIHQHNVSLVDKIHEPNIEQVNDALICANHSFQQLNLISQHEDNSYVSKDGKVTGILSLLNQCKTKMGKRQMNELIMHPLSSSDKLEKMYYWIQYFLDIQWNFDTELTPMCDLERMLTKLKMRRLTPSDIHSIYETHGYMNKLSKQFLKKRDKLFRETFLVDKVYELHKDFTSSIKNTFQLSICSQMNHLNFDKFNDINDKLFCNGVNPELDQLIRQRIENQDKLNAILREFETFFKEKKKNQVDFIKLHKTSNGDISLQLTNLRGKKMKEMINHKIKQGTSSSVLSLSFESSFDNQTQTFSFDLENVYFKELSNKNTIVSSTVIDQLVHMIQSDNIRYLDVLENTYKMAVQTLYDDYFQHLVNFIECVKMIDITNTKANLARQFNLCKPEIQEHDHSFVDAKKLRHMLIEHIETREMYVPNDICLGKEESQSGVLLYGTNAVGKTSLIKALGIAVIMAQSGFYVPCESFVFKPYQYIFTRIIGNDNIFKGLSTFAVEMSELRVILQSCNENSLILGDELCSGTEIDSALSIFISSLEVMTQRQSSFIFATHFHELQQMKEMKEMTNIQCKHLKVQFDHEKQQLYYDRRLQDGQGESIYGLEVCKSLKLPDDFLDRCYDIRNSYIQNKNNILSMKVSKYNKDKLRNMCEFCNENIGTEIHHLQYQKEANDNHYINNSFHKNHSANLASICEKCHQHVHALNLRFEKRKTMDGGYELLLKKN